MKTDTIAAIATGLSEAGIGIVRMSGEQAVAIADRLFRTPKGRRKLLTVKSHTIHYGYLVSCRCEEAGEDEKSLRIDGKDGGAVGEGSKAAGESGEEEVKEEWKRFIIDEVMVSVMRAPNSYTKEDTVEINCHGGILMVKRVLEEVLRAGARLAEPGEFTKRAFLNGRIDLTKAESVIDIIHSKNQWALQSSVDQLKGSVYETVKEMRAGILYEIAFIESALDDPEHISLEGYPDRLLEKVRKLTEEMKRLISSADYGKLMKEGINTVIVGKPNVGKSSLLNLLTGEDTAIVTEVPGTTRDVLQESVLLNGISFNITDTAGIRDTEDVVERIGVEKAKRSAEKADLLIFVIDISVPLEESDREIASLIPSGKSIVLLNKSDLTAVVTEEDIYEMFGNRDVRIIRTSTLEGQGIDGLEKAVTEMFFHGRITMNNEVTITNLRHKEALQNACDDLERVEQSILDGMPEDFYSIDLMGAYSALGTMIGEETGEDLINEIFSKFCVGK